MAWIYLAALEDSAWLLNHGSDLSHSVKTIDTAKECSYPGCLNAYCQSPRFGMTCKLLREPISRVTCLASFTVGSRAKISVLQELESAWEESEADFSTKLCGFPKNSNLRGSFSKTCQPYELEDFEALSENLPIWGMTVDGRVSLPQKLEPRTYAKDGSYWPTPNANRAGWNQGGGAGRVGKKRPTWWTFWGGIPSPLITEYAMAYPKNWTELKDWAMQWFQSKPGKRSKG